MELLKQLLSIPTVSGTELESAKKIAECFNTSAVDVKIDGMGNITAVKKGKNGKTILLDAHYDNIGLMITGITDGGFLSFTTVGGVDTRILPSLEVTVYGKKPIPGVIGTKPPHLMSGGERLPYKVSELYIDCGLSKEEIEKIVSVGDCAGFNLQLIELRNNLVSAAGLDDKIGVYITAKVLEGLSPICDVCAAAVISEEIGLKGAKTLAAAAKPDLAVVIDVTHGTTPDGIKERSSALGEGGVIAYGTVLSEKYNEKLKSLAEKNGIPIQTEVEEDNPGTDGWIYQNAHSGIPTIMLSIPQRYMHTQSEVISLDDVDNIIKLLKIFLEEEALDA